MQIMYPTQASKQHMKTAKANSSFLTFSFNSTTTTTCSSIFSSPSSFSLSSFLLSAAMDSANWPQDNGSADHDHIQAQPVEKKARAADNKVEALNCPRCNSSNTKFCYYNNYNLSQPRYLCKSCRRYWTQGGSLRNVPVGGGSRKNKRSNSKNKITQPNFSSPQIPKVHHESQNLNLGFNPAQYNESSNFFAFDAKSFNQNPNVLSSNFSIMGTAGNVSSSGLGLSSLMSVPIPEANSAYLSGVPVHHDQFKPGLSFSLYEMENGCGNLQAFQDHINNPSKIFPFEELKQPVMNSSTDPAEKDKVQGEYNGYWNGNSSW